MESVLRLVASVGGSALVAFVVVRAVDLLARHADARHHETPLWGLLRRCRTPLFVVLLTALLRWTYPASASPSWRSTPTWWGTSCCCA